MQKPTLVIGASVNPDRYSYKAIVQLLKHDITVFAIANKAGSIQDVNFSTQKESLRMYIQLRFILVKRIKKYIIITYWT